MKRTGFTLVELLIVIAIIAVVVGLILPQLGSFNKGQTLSDAAYQMQSVLRTAQSNASNGVSCDGANPVSSWSVFWANMADDYVYPFYCNRTPPLGNIKVAEYSLPSGIVLDSVKVNDCDADLKGKMPQIFFTAVSGEMVFDHSETACQRTYSQRKMEIVLADDGGQKATVVVELGGSIYVSSD